jgi:hypothetical protein
MPRSAALLLTLVLVTALVLLAGPAGAQGGRPPGASMMPPAGGMMPGGMGGMPGMGAPSGGGGGGLTETPMPAELTITYSEFLARHPDQTGVSVPDEYKSQKLSETQWLQVMRIFRGAMVGISERGRIGAGLREQAAKEIAGKKAEMQVMREIHDEAVKSAFWYEVSWPRVVTDANDPGNVTVYVDVVERVRPAFAERALAKLQPFSGYAPDRQPFTLITRKGSFYRRAQLLLSPEAVAYWPGLWTGDQIELRVYDKDGRSVTTVSPQPASHSGATILAIVSPPQIRITSVAGTALPVIGPDTARYGQIPAYALWHKQDGSQMKLDGTDGWMHTFSFTIGINKLGSIDHMEARLIAGAAPAGGAGRAGMPGMRGGPGMMGPGMGGSMMPPGMMGGSRGAMMGSSGMMGPPPGMR